MTTDPNWLEIVSESYTQEVSESARNLQEEADQIYTLIETIETALDVDLTESQVDALISALSESQRTARVLDSAERKRNISYNDDEEYSDRRQAAEKAVKIAQARHNQDEMQRRPRVVTRAKRFALKDEGKRDLIKTYQDQEDDARSRRNFQITSGRPSTITSRLKFIAQARAKKDADEASDPENIFKREQLRAIDAAGIASELMGTSWSTGNKDRRASGAVRTPKKNRNRKKD